MVEVKRTAEKSRSEMKENSFCEENERKMGKIGKKFVTFGWSLDALRVSPEYLQTDCFAEPVLSVTMIFQVTS